MKPIKYFSMFSGIGGFEYGLDQSDYEFECVGFSEIDKYAESIYLRWFPEHKNYGDATKIRTEDLPDFEFLVGGFPCQAFSIAGKRRGFDDTRGTLFFEIARILKDKRPRYFLLENVKNLLSHNKGETFKKILEILSDLGYIVEWEVYNSKWFVPQNRERIFLKGYLAEECGGKILSVREDYEEDTVISESADRKPVKNPHQILSDFEEVDNGKYMPKTKNGDVFAITTRCRDMPLNKKQDNYLLEKCLGSTQSHASKTDGSYCTCIATDRNNVPHLQFRRENSSGELLDDYVIRTLTPCELEPLQGFPVGWTSLNCWGEEVSDTQRYKCIGNAVTPAVITDIVNEVFSK